MKFWSILKDSFREAIDCKVMYVTVGLSCVVILFVGSSTFKPMSAKETMENLLTGNFLFITKALQGEQDSMKEPRKGVPAWAEGPFKLRGVRAVKGVMDSPDAEYLVIVSQNHTDVAEVRRTRQDPQLALETLRNLFMFA